MAGTDPVIGPESRDGDEPAPVFLELSGVTRTFGSGVSSTAALSEVSFRVDRGEFVAIIGASGSGKSTLLNILGLLDRPTEGDYRIDGVDVRGLSERERDRLRSSTIGFVFQSSHMIGYDTLAENAGLALRIQRVGLRERSELVGAALADLEVRSRADVLARNLSGGERQRGAIARAISARPRLILADEPTGALDTENSRLIIDHLRRLHREGATVLIITHDPDIAARADRRITLRDGRILEDTGPGPHRGRPVPTVARPRPVRRTRGRIWAMLRGWGDDVVQAVSGHTARPGRALLLLCAFLLGTGGLVTSLGLSQSAAVQISDRITAAALDEVVVHSSDHDLLRATSTRERLAAVEGVTAVGYWGEVDARSVVATRFDPATPGTPTAKLPTIVADTDYLRLTGSTVVPQATMDAGVLDAAWAGDVVILGQGAAEKLGVAEAGPGQQIRVGGRPTDVIGILTESAREPTLLDAVILPVGVAGGVEPGEPELVLRTEPGYPAPVAEVAAVAVRPDQPGLITTSTVADLRSLHRGVANDFGVLIGVISIVLLVLASLSAATAMYLSVQSRASEIALRRAVGASRADIWRMFMLEGATIGLAGGVAGSAVGTVATVVLAATQGWVPVLDLSTVAVGTVAGAVTGLLSATVPAILAARVDPAAGVRG